MPKQRETLPLSEGDQTWIGSTRGIYTNRTETLVPSAFTAQITDGYIPSGTAVSVVNDVTKPYLGTAGQPFSGFIFTDQVVGPNTAENLNYPLMDHGRVRVERLPNKTFVIPAAADNKTTIVFD